MEERPSLNTRDVRCAVLSVDNWVDCAPGIAALWLEVDPSIVVNARVGSIGPYNFLRVQGRVAGLYAIEGDHVEEISEPCSLCEEDGRVLEERHGGQSERWVACSCPSGHGEPGEWS